METSYGLFKNGSTPQNAIPSITKSAATWGEAVRYFASGNFGGGAVYNLKTGKHIANVASGK